jgi:transketolase
MDAKTMRKVADNIRILEAAMVEKAKSGHPGGSMSGTDYVNTLYSKYIVYDPDDAKWDFEALHAVDLELFNTQLTQLLNV